MDKIEGIKYSTVALLALNAFTLVLSVLMFFHVPLVGSIMDYLLLPTWLVNFVYIAIIFNIVNANTKKGHYIYLICWVSILSMLLCIAMMSYNLFNLAFFDPGVTKLFISWAYQTPLLISLTFTADIVLMVFTFLQINNRGVWKVD